ncbi:Alcohol oxidase [Mycena venus]|uniref:Alcohol oxidase n=1 Tax=Mycena venus TaxID=2733690 RepID=A0A8H6XS51_9AGAR|nr:Alcohol oxidase [Mycena venus]
MVLECTGGGTSGLTLATRLSEDPSVSVIVIEAGPANLDDPEILNPALIDNRFGRPEYDWGFQTVPQKFCKDRSVPFNRGKGLGGSSALNFLQYHRPARSDIDALGELGNQGWNWELLEPYYAKSERFILPVEKNNTLTYDVAHHGLDGPLAVGFPTPLSTFEHPFQMAMKNLGIDLIKDPIKGAWYTPVTIDPTERVRSYAANKYYQPNASRENLTVVVCAQVTKIVTELDHNALATAVEVVFHNEEALYTVKVGKEVILSAGTIMSPQILELSGIGDRTILQEFDIEPRVHLPGVGENVQEHFFSGVVSEVRPEVVSELYQTSGTGIFGIPPTCISFVPLATISADHETLQKSLATLINEAISSKRISPSLQKQYEITLKHQQDREPSCEFILWPLWRPIPNTPAPGKQYLIVSTLLNHPISRGSIHIASSDPLVPPKINPRYFEYEYDLLQLVEQIKFARKILDQEPVKNLLAGNELSPGRDVQTDEQIADFVKSALSTTWHTVGSCSMLPLEDGGVVDSRLKVHSTTNIRVIDMSIIPLHICAHTQATAYALGELGADIIKGKALISGD